MSGSVFGDERKPNSRSNRRFELFATSENATNTPESVDVRSHFF